MFRKSKIKTSQQGGQILIILLLIVLVGLTIALAASQRSTLSLNNSDKNDQSSRAYDAAEAVIEQAISQNLTSGSLNLSFNNQSNATLTAAKYPQTTGSQILEYLEPITKDTMAQFWLDDPNCDYTSSATAATSCWVSGVDFPAGGQFSIYYGNVDIDPQANDAPALEVNIVTSDPSTGDYSNTRVVYDGNVVRRSSNNFLSANCKPIGTDPADYYSETTTFGSNRKFKCQTPSITVPSGTPVLVRVRFLYMTKAQVLALAPVGVAPLPAQATVYTAYGYSGQTVHKLQRFVESGVVSPLLDFSIFSASNLSSGS